MKLQNVLCFLKKELDKNKLKKVDDLDTIVFTNFCHR